VISHPEKDRTLKSFAKYSMTLVELLQKAGPVDVAEQMRMENHLLMIQMAYVAWKHRNGQTQS
jgi:hypothetical protein